MNRASIILVSNDEKVPLAAVVPPMIVSSMVPPTTLGLVIVLLVSSSIPSNVETVPLTGRTRLVVPVVFSVRALAPSVVRSPARLRVVPAPVSVLLPPMTLRVRSVSPPLTEKPSASADRINPLIVPSPVIVPATVSFSALVIFKLLVPRTVASPGTLRLLAAKTTVPLADNNSKDPPPPDEIRSDWVEEIVLGSESDFGSISMLLVPRVNTPEGSTSNTASPPAFSMTRGGADAFSAILKTVCAFGSSN